MIVRCVSVHNDYSCFFLVRQLLLINEYGKEDLDKCIDSFSSGDGNMKAVRILFTENQVCKLHALCCRCLFNTQAKTQFNLSKVRKRLFWWIV